MLLLTVPAQGKCCLFLRLTVLFICSDEGHSNGASIYKAYMQLPESVKWPWPLTFTTWLTLNLNCYHYLWESSWVLDLRKAFTYAVSHLVFFLFFVISILRHIYIWIGCQDILSFKSPKIKKKLQIQIKWLVKVHKNTGYNESVFHGGYIASYTLLYIVSSRSLKQAVFACWGIF